MTPAEDHTGGAGTPARRWREVAALFLKLGTTSFGGPAAHTAFMEQEIVQRRAWITPEHFLDLVGATNLIPGPNSTEMAIHIGYERAGWPGLLAAGGGFILPATLLTGLLAAAYVHYGAKPSFAPVLFGIKPAVLAVILAAVWRLTRSSVKSWRLGLLGVAVVLSSLAGVGELSALFGGGLLGTLWLWAGQRPAARCAAFPVLPLGAGKAQLATLGVAASGAAVVSLWELGLFFLKVGAVLYGTGYVLLAFLEGGLVQQRGWLTQAQLMDAVAMGQFTPGPLLSTATFVGYLVGGAPGALVATVAIFLPSFAFVALTNPLIPRLRKTAWTAAFLDAINVSSIALMLSVTVRLAAGSLVSWQAWLIGAVAAVAALRFRVHPAWLVLGGGLAGWLLGR